MASFAILSGPRVPVNRGFASCGGPELISLHVGEGAVGLGVLARARYVLLRIEEIRALSCSNFTIT